MEAEVSTLVRDVTGGRGVNVVLEPHGTALLEDDLAVIGPGGRIVLFDNAGGGQLASLPDVERLFAANASVGGFSLAAWPRRCRHAS